ncbi:MAG: tail fiber domain-containing protein, partial [Candidatus Pacebacteria bacterium]|nr:tail fiber domain-containing protein [Candidatus Paceibacterota bacterium]
GSSSITTTGTVTGGTLAGTLSTAAQGSVTSLGTLTTLTVDSIIINGTNIGHTSDTDAIAIASSGNVTVSQDLSVSGDLTVSGTTTTVDSTVLTVVDPIIHLQTATGGGALSGDTDKDVGLALQYHNGSAAKTAFLGYDDSAGKLTFIPDATLSSEVVSGTAGTIVADLEGTVQTAAQGSITSLGTLTALTVDNVAINGATVGHTSDTDLMTLASGALTLAGTLTVGVDNTGHDVKFFGATSGNYFSWDESADEVNMVGTIKLKEQADAHADTAAFGQIWVNTATPNELYFTTDAGNDIQLTSGTAIAATPGGSTTQVQYNNSGAFAGHSGLVYASGTGTLSATVLTETSDRTYKENITNYNSNEALQAVMALQSHRYSWKESGIEEIGLIADEVQDVLPEMVHVDADSGVKGLKYTKMTAVLLEALKEQQIQIKEQQVQIDELKSKINYKK